MHYHYQKQMIILCVNLLIFNIFFITFTLVTPKTVTKQACESIGILLHFFLLSSFFLMSEMAFLRYLLVSSTLREFKNYTATTVVFSYRK